MAKTVPAWSDLYGRCLDAKQYEASITRNILPLLDADTNLSRLRYYRALRRNGNSRAYARSSAYLYAINCIAVKVNLLEAYTIDMEARYT